MKRHRVALFGEASKGAFKTPHFVTELPHLIDHFGEPPNESEGLYFAIQAILFQRELIYFRVEEEGFSPADYFHGFKYLADREQIKAISALCLPGVGDADLLSASQAICNMHQSLLITTQKDLYDYLTSHSNRPLP